MNTWNDQVLVPVQSEVSDLGMKVNLLDAMRRREQSQSLISTAPDHAHRMLELLAAMSERIQSLEKQVESLQLRVVELEEIQQGDGDSWIE